MDLIRNHSEALVNIIANPSLKINNTNQKEIRRVLYAIVEQAMIQNSAINTLMDRLMEQREVTNMILEKRDSVFMLMQPKNKKERKEFVAKKRRNRSCIYISQQ